MPSSPRSATTSVAPNSRPRSVRALVPAHEDDPLGAELLRREDGEEADRAVADHGDVVPRCDATHQRRVVAGAVDVGEGEQRRVQRRVDAGGHLDERAVGQRHAHRLGLAAADAVACPEAAVPARGLQALAAEVAGAVRPGERCDDEVAGRQGRDLGADLLDDADELVAHRASAGGRRQVVVRVQVAAADAGAHDPHDRVGRLHDDGVGNVLDPDVAGAVHESCSHEKEVLQSGCLVSVVIHATRMPRR